MENEIFVTILMSVYNEEVFVKESIESILNQTYGNFEFIIIDDASTDATVEVIESFSDERITLIRNSENKGLTKNLNIGLRKAGGKYILRMDADDIALPTRIARQVEFMEKNPEVALAGTGMRYFGNRYDIVKVREKDEELRAGLFFNSVIMHPTFIIRKSTIDEHRITYNEQLRYAQDYCFTEEISRYGKLGNIQDVLLKYRSHDGQVTVYKAKGQKKCADITRAKLLENLKVDFSDKEFTLWSKLCLSELENLSDEDKGLLDTIIAKVMTANAGNGFVDEAILERAIANRKSYGMTKMINEKNNSRYILQIDVLNQWLKLKLEGRSIEEYFRKRKYMTLAIYGLAELGKRLYDELEHTDIEVKYFMDRNEGAHYKDLDKRDIDSGVSDVDVLVITPMHCFDAIKEQLEVADGVEVISIQDVVYNI